MKAAGAARVLAVVKEDIGTEIADFRKGYWKGEVFLDEKKAFFAALGGGKVHEPYTLATFLAMIANPFTKSRTKKNLAMADKKRVANNMTGEGFIAGGVYVIRKDGKAAYSFLEEDIGDSAPVEDVVAAVKAAVKGEEYNLAPMSQPGAAAETGRMTWKAWANRSFGPDGYVCGDVSRGIAASFSRKKSGCSR
eukprot:TRINITY_DN71694_c0_g1_i1.p2 TRINITY_DN71694_c0_g1~~TRINITY_DN71694_c0_g1_i1.p2  ORF type:complete len:193 (-),score=55.74 TRINITY_DN71694_c0_g1_i1:9-587(-)